MGMIGKNILPVLMILACVWGFWGFIIPSYEDIQGLRSAKAGYEKAISNAEEVRHLRGELLVVYNSIPKEQWDRLSSVLPHEINGVKLITDINGIAANHGILVEEFNVKDIAPIAPNVATVLTDAQVAAPMNAYRTTELTMKFDSAYQNFTSFLQTLEKSLQVFDVVDIQLDRAPETTDEKEKTTKTRTYGYTVKIKLYWLE